MTSNNPEQSNCCKAPITPGGDVRTGFYVCTECQRACDVYVPYESVRRLPEQNKPEHPEPWEAEFEKHAAGARQFIESQGKTGSPVIPEGHRDCCYWCGHSPDRLKAFIRKVAQQARQEALEKAVRALEAAYNCGDQCLDNAIEDVKSLLTNPKTND